MIGSVNATKTRSDYCNARFSGPRERDRESQVYGGSTDIRVSVVREDFRKTGRDVARRERWRKKDGKTKCWIAQRPKEYLYPGLIIKLVPVPRTERVQIEDGPSALLRCIKSILGTPVVAHGPMIILREPAAGATTMVVPTVAVIYGHVTIRERR